MRLQNRAVAAAALVAAAWCATCGVAGAEPPPSPPPPPAPKTTIDSDGTFVVGTDIVPGTYASAGPVADGVCYWKRTGGLDGDDIVDNALTKKPQVVQIAPGDKSFTTNDCQPWQMTDAPAPGSTPGALPPLLAQWQLRNYLNTINGNAGQIGAPPLPGP